MKLPRRFVPGMEVFAGNQHWLILDIVDLEHLLVRGTGKNKRRRLLKIAEVKLERSSSPPPPMLPSIPDEAWEAARERFNIIQPLIDLGAQRTRSDVERVAKLHEKNTSTIYNWLHAYESSKLLSSLVRRPRSDKQKPRIAPQIEKIVQKQIEQTYLIAERPALVDLKERIYLDCGKAGLKPPHINTIGARIADIAPKLKMARRHSAKEAKERFVPLRGSFPSANFPLAVAQIDHTPVDLILVNETDRNPIGKAYLTIVIDVFSRMVLGFYISLDPSGNISTGAALNLALRKKEPWLTERNINASWPCYGVPYTIHVDNAKEFRGTMLSKACQEYGITLQNRPKGQPQYGGHVERCFRTFLRKVHTIPGTTFSNIAEKLSYDSEDRAIMTLHEFEEWFSIFIIKYYHQRYHRGIQMTPIAKWEQGLLGDSTQLGIGAPIPVQDEERLYYDFLPVIERTIQREGVSNEYISYYHDALRKWVKSVDRDNPKKSRLFTFRIDYRDISQLYFLDPDTNQYIAIPYRDPTHPAISMWDHRDALKQIRDRGIATVNETMLFEAIEEMNEVVDRAAEKTKVARRAQQRRRNHEKAAKKREKNNSKSSFPAFSGIVPSQEQPEQQDAPETEDQVLPFDDYRAPE